MCEAVTVYSRGSVFFDRLHSGKKKKKKGSGFAFLVKTLSWDRKQEWRQREREGGRKEGGGGRVTGHWIHPVRRQRSLAEREKYYEIKRQTMPGLFFFFLGQCSRFKDSSCVFSLECCALCLSCCISLQFLLVAVRALPRQARGNTSVLPRLLEGSLHGRRGWPATGRGTGQWSTPPKHGWMHTNR